MTVLSQKEFAELLGRDKSYITRLKQNGQLVMTEDNRVDVEASMELMLASTGNTPAGRANADRWAEYRRANAPQPPATGLQPDESGISLSGADVATKLTLKTKAESLRKLMADADRAQLERDLMLRKVVYRDEVQADLATAAGGINNAFEGFEDRVIPLLGLPDDKVARARAILRDERVRCQEFAAHELARVASQDAGFPDH